MFSLEDAASHPFTKDASVLDEENIARDELLLRLETTAEELEHHLLQRLEGKLLLSRLMISFFFKGGHEALGCKFSHKSFREYLFAERLVELLKGYGRQVGEVSRPAPREGAGLGATPVDGRVGQATELCTRRIWAVIRDALADLWDWWGSVRRRSAAGGPSAPRYQRSSSRGLRFAPARLGENHRRATHGRRRPE